MSDFYYEAHDEAGQSISGRIRAMDVKDAIRQLEANRWEVVSVRTVPRTSLEADFGTGEGSSEQGSAEKEMPAMSRRESLELLGHVGEAMQAGLPLVPGLAALAKELPDGKVRRGLKVMVSQLEAGRSLEAVLENRHVPFDLRSLVRVGVRSGHTGEVLSQYVRHTQHMHDIRRRMALAWGYPLVLILSSAAILFFFLWFLVPRFTEIFEDFGTELPSMTNSLIWTSKMLHEHWDLILISLGVLILLVRLLWRHVFSPAERRRFLWCLPLVGNMIRAAAMARFSRLLGLLIENDVPLPEALRLAGEGSADAQLGEAALDLADVVESGRPLSGRESACRRFPSIFVQLLSQVENQKPKTAARHTVAEACFSSARMFESQARVAAARITALCQPLIVIFTGCTVGYLVIALFMPLVKLLNDLS